MGKHEINLELQLVQVKCVAFALLGSCQFFNVTNHFPEEVEQVLKRYGEIWVNDDHTKEEKLTPSARLTYH